MRILSVSLLIALAPVYAQRLTTDEQGGSRPVPDPTTLTTLQLTQQINSLKELMEQQDAGLVQNLETRLAGMDKAIELLQTRSDKLPVFIADQIAALRLLHEERFNSIAQQFKERDTRTDQLATASTVAINAALQAAKEAVVNQNISNEKAIAKSEANTTKLLDNLDTKIIDLKESIGALKNQGIGQTAQKESQNNDASFYVAALAVIVAIVGAGIAVMRPKSA